MKITMSHALAVMVGCAALPVSTGCVDDALLSGDVGGGETSSSRSAGAGGGGATSVTASGGAASGGAGGSAATGGGSGLYDPNEDGPFAIAEIDATTVSSTGNSVAIHCAHPVDDSDGPYPVVLVGHGFQLPPSQYFSYVRRLATFGYVAMTVDFPAGFGGTDHVANAEDLLHGITWASETSPVAELADTSRVGTSGHSLGGKVALLAASMDDRVKASVTLDPVDGGMNCSPAQCPDVSAMLPLPIPTAFLGETTDAVGTFQACAPAAENFDTFYANAAAPSVRVEVLGANHMSFLDDVASCGFTCNFCNAATTDNATVNALARAWVVAFYQRHLKGVLGYDTYLTGSEAEARYVTTGLATINAKP